MLHGRDLTTPTLPAGADARPFGCDGDGYRVVFSTRHGGVSAPPYDSLNIGFSVGDDPDAVRRNRDSLCAAAGVAAADLVVPGQVHGTGIAAVGGAERGRGARDPGSVIAATDGLVTSHEDVPLVVSFADCVPVFVAGERDDGSAVVALVHAGWRGMLAGMAGAAAHAVRRAGARPLAAVIGPSICRRCFTVGADVGERFEREFPGSYSDGRVDLWAVATRQLLAAGLDAADVVVSSLCTVCDRRFFSHRRDAGLTGRQAAIAWIPGSPRRPRKREDP